MKNDIIERNYSPHNLESVTGAEALTFMESFYSFYKEFSLNLDKKFAKFKNSMHKVDMSNGIRNVSNFNYFKVSNNKIATSTYFDPESITWEEYVKNVLNTTFIQGHLLEEANGVYNWLKSIAVEGKAPITFRYKFSSFYESYLEIKNFILSLEDKRRNEIELGKMYPNFPKIKDISDTYNKAVATVKSRDVELLSKQLDQIKRMGDLIIAKIKANDISLERKELENIASILDEFSDVTTVIGSGIGLINELRDVFDVQNKELSKMKNM